MLGYIKPCFSIVSDLKLRKFSGKIRISFREINPQLIWFWRFIKSAKGVHVKKSWGNTIICRFLQGIWFHSQRKDGANTSSIWSPQRNCYNYNDAQQKYECNGLLTCNTDFFDIVAWVLQVPYIFIICLGYVFQTSIDLRKENGLTLKKAISKQYPTDNTDDLVLLANISVA